MANYLTIQEAATATGKSARTIRRLCYDEGSKDFVTHDEKNRLLVDANFLTQHYPLTIAPNSGKPNQNDNSQRVDKSKDTTIDTDKTQDAENLVLRIALLQQELKLKEELYLQVSREKDKQIEILERTLLMLGEGQKKEPTLVEPTPVTQAPAPEPTATPSPEPTAIESVVPEQPKPEPVKKKRWWQF